MAAAAAFLLLGWVGVPAEGGPIFCTFRRLTGIPCPGCGMTRAMAALARGDLGAAVRFHPFAPLLLVEGAGLWATVGTALVRQRPLTLPGRLPELLVIWQAVGFLALWIGRLATGTLPW